MIPDGGMFTFFTLILIHLVFKITRVTTLSNECIVNYSLTCPEGWKLINFNQCQCPISYTGPCDCIISTVKPSNTAKSVDFKKKLESKCNVNWPCNEIDTDYNKDCPDLWFIKPNKVCSPTYGYAGNCSDHHYSNVEDKRRWSHICNLKWSTEKPKDNNTITGCPKGWDRMLDLCIAPKTYNGPCLPVASIVNLSQSFKKTYSFLCNVTF